MEQWGLGAEKVLIIIIRTSGLVMKLAHLSLHLLVEEFCLSGHDLC
jgi:hypothetical protein